MRQGTMALRLTPLQFRLQYTPRPYACEDPDTGSLRPVPPGTTRRELYCVRCEARRCGRCLFGLFDIKRPRRRKKKSKGGFRHI